MERTFRLVAGVMVCCGAVWALAGSGCLTPDFSKSCGEGEPQCYQGEVCYHGKCVDPSAVPADGGGTTRDTGARDGGSGDGGDEPGDTIAKRDGGGGRDAGDDTGSSTPDGDAPADSDAGGLPVEFDSTLPCEKEGAYGDAGTARDGAGLKGPGEACNERGGTSDCRSSCVNDECVQRFFTTDRTFHADFGGLSGADRICQELADRADLGGTWRAVLGDGQTSIEDHLKDFDTIVRDLAGRTIFKPATYLDRQPHSAPSYNQCGVEIPSSENEWAWTGEGASEAGSDGGSSCASWTSRSGSEEATIGQFRGYLGERWKGWNEDFCDGTYHLYCIEQ